MNARVLLLNPSTADVSTEVLLNLAYLAASLRKNGHEVKIIDATAPFKQYTERQIEKIITDFNPHFIGVTLTIIYITQTYNFLKRLQKMRTPIVAGGPHANALPEEVLENGADIVAIGEGEDTIVELAELFLGNKTINEVPGLCYKDSNSKVHYTPSRALIKNLDDIPFPDFNDFPIKNYTGSEDVNSNPIFWSIFTSRGCPFNCTFCSSHNVFGRSIRFRSAQNIFAEIKSLVENFRVEKITFQDDEILCRKDRFIELCDLICDSNLRINMSMRTRIDSIDKDILLKAKAAGITRISFGIESFNNDTLKKINKKYTVEKIRDKLKVLEEVEFPYISFNNIYGFPWETKEHFLENIKEIAAIPKSIAYFTTMATPIPFPKTALYDTYHKKYGFTGWWLKAEKHPPRMNDSKPLFMQLASMMMPLYVNDRYWNYSRSKKKEVYSFSWVVFKLFLKRHFSLLKYLVIIMLCRLSLFFWKISPKFERFFMKHFDKKLSKLKEKVSFIDKY